MFQKEYDRNTEAEPKALNTEQWKFRRVRSEADTARSASSALWWRSTRVRKPSYRHRHSRNCSPGLAQDTQNPRKDRAKRGPFVERAFRRFSTTSEVVIWEPALGERTDKCDTLSQKQTNSFTIVRI